jgi:hypothetical protein
MALAFRDGRLVLLVRRAVRARWSWRHRCDLRVFSSARGVRLLACFRAARQRAAPLVAGEGLSPRRRVRLLDAVGNGNGADAFMLYIEAI